MYNLRQRTIMQTLFRLHRLIREGKRALSFLIVAALPLISSDILRMLQQFAFTSSWCEWFRACVSTISYSIFYTCPPPDLGFPSMSLDETGGRITPSYGNKSHAYLLCLSHRTSPGLGQGAASPTDVGCVWASSRTLAPELQKWVPDQRWFDGCSLGSQIWNI